MVLIGRVTKDAVITTLKDERRVTNFTIAVNDWYKPKGQEKSVSVTTFIDCAYWINPAIAERLTKGSLVEITGKLKVSAYINMQNEAVGKIHCHADSIKIHQQVKTDASKTMKKKESVPDDLPF